MLVQYRQYPSIPDSPPPWPEGNVCVYTCTRGHVCIHVRAGVIIYRGSHVRFHVRVYSCVYLLY